MTEDEKIERAIRGDWSGYGMSEDVYVIKTKLYANLQRPVAYAIIDLPRTVLSEEEWIARDRANKAAEREYDFTDHDDTGDDGEDE